MVILWGARCNPYACTSTGHNSLPSGSLTFIEQSHHRRTAVHTQTPASRRTRDLTIVGISSAIASREKEKRRKQGKKKMKSVFSSSEPRFHPSPGTIKSIMKGKKEPFDKRPWVYPPCKKTGSPSMHTSPFSLIHHRHSSLFSRRRILRATVTEVGYSSCAERANQS